MTVPVGPRSPSEEEVRSLVERVLDGVIASDPPPAPEITPTHPPSRLAPEAMKIAIGADHGGFPLKERIGFRLREAGYEVLDCGTDSHEAVDYPDFAHAVAREVASGACSYGIVIDGAGIGSAMAASKVPGVRCPLLRPVRPATAGSTTTPMSSPLGRD